MYFLSKFCGVCLKNENILKLSDKDNDGIRHIDKLAASVVGMNFKEMNDVRFICAECCTTLNTVYNFQQKCLRSKANLINYISQLQTFSKVRGTLSVRLRDIKSEIKLEKQDMVQICENETDNETKTWISQDSISDQGINFSVVRIKKEPTIEGNCNHTLTNHLFKNNSIDIKEEKSDLLFKNSSVNIKEEKTENMNITENKKFMDKNVENGHVHIKEEAEDLYDIEDNNFENYEEDPFDDVDSKSGINIEENPLESVKDEPISDSETPQDGSTSQKNCGEKTRENELSNKKSIIPNELVDKNYKCEICNKKFSKNTSLKIHMKLHSDENPYVCEVCNTKFAKKSCLDVHMRRHTGERPYECEICKKKFTLKGHFNEHMRTHSGERPYECEICKKSFVQRGGLSTHMRYHSGVRPFACTMCKKSFTQRRALTSHLRNHTGEKPFECELCPRSFTQGYIRTRHMKTHHPDDLKSCA